MKTASVAAATQNQNWTGPTVRTNRERSNKSRIAPGMTRYLTLALIWLLCVTFFGSRLAIVVYLFWFSFGHCGLLFLTLCWPLWGFVSIKACSRKNDLRSPCGLLYFASFTVITHLTPFRSLQNSLWAATRAGEQRIGRRLTRRKCGHSTATDDASKPSASRNSGTLDPVARQDVPRLTTIV